MYRYFRRLCPLLIVLLSGFHIYAATDSVYRIGTTKEKNLEFSDAIHYYKLALVQYTVEKKYEQAITIANKLARVYSWLNYPDSAIQVLESLQELPENYKTSVLYTRTMLLTATGYISIGNKSKAAEYLKIARDAIESNFPDSTLLLAGLISAEGEYLILNHNYHDALLKQREALEMLHKAGLVSNELNGLIYFRVGNVHLILDNFSESEENYSRALLVFNMNYPGLHPVFAALYEKLGVLYKDSEDFFHAEKYIKKLESIYNTHPVNNKSYPSLFFYKAYLLYIQKKKYEAEVYYTKAIQEFEKNELIKDERYLLSLINLGNIAIENQNYEGAISFFKKHLRMSSLHYPEKKYRSLAHIADVYTYTGKYEEAENFFQSSYNECTQYYNIASSETVKVLLRWAFLYAMKKDYATAIKISEKALELTDEFTNAWRNRKTDALYYLSYFYFMNKNFSQTISTIQQYFTIFHDLPDAFAFSCPSVDKTNANIEVIRFLSLKGEAMLKLGKDENDPNMKKKYLQSSLLHLDKSIDLFEMLAEKSKFESDLLYNSGRYRFIYLRAAGACSELYQHTGNPAYIDTAFMYSEKVKASVLKASINKSKSLGREVKKNNNSELIEEVIRKRDFYHDLIIEEEGKPEPDSTYLARWKDQLFFYQYRFDSLKVLEPGLTFRFFETGLEVYPFNAREHLAGNQSMLHYMIDREEKLLLCFCLDKNTLKMHSGKIDDNLFRDIDTLYSMINTGFTGMYTRDHLQRFIKVSARLHDILIKPFQQEIKNKRLVIVPDPLLSKIPFEVLLTSGEISPKSGYGELPYLLHSNPLSYRYAALLMNEKTASPWKKKKLLGVVPDYNFQESNKPGEKHKKLSTLKNALTEVQFVASIFRGNVLTGSSATKNNFITKAGSYDILHLAMHAEADKQEPLYSRLYFQPTDTTNGNDVLQAWEIYNMQLDASMVVMSSCESGYGEVHGTEGMLSLSRAFRYAGAASVVYTLWPVSDKSSAEVMHYFYRFLDKGMSRDEAMQQAKLTYLETSDPALLHPAFWAGYTVNGNVEKVKINPVNKKIYIGTGLILLLIVILLTKKIRSKES